MRIAVIGTGYVGLVTGVVLAELGNDVICVDNDPAKIEKIRSGVPPIYEPGIEELLKKAISEGFLSVTDSIADATVASEVIFIAVGTPPGEDGTPDLTAVKAVAAEIGRAIKKPTVVVNKSTVPVGSGELVERIISEQGVPHHLFDVVSNPEFLREGSAIYDTLHPDRIVIGAKRREAAIKLVELYATLEAPMIITDLNSAELIKYASNSFLAMKISFINAISRICELTDANVADVAKGMGLDKRIGSQFLSAGLGWGGSCFPKDVLGMLSTAGRYGYDFGLMQEVININDDQTLNFVRRLAKRLNGLEGKRIGIMGLAFKPNTDDIRDAKALVIVEEIVKAGGSVSAYDPIATDNFRRFFPDINYKDSVYEVSEDADALVLVTEWNEFRQLDLNRLGSKMKTRVLFDGRRVYKKETAERAGFDYYTIGSN
jgi:UDPglucose 6-dehydrogenase